MTRLVGVSATSCVYSPCVVCFLVCVCGTRQGDVIYLHEPLLWTLRQHATNGVSGPDSLARAIGAVAAPLLEITARVGEDHAVDAALMIEFLGFGLSSSRPRQTS